MRITHISPMLMAPIIAIIGLYFGFPNEIYHIPLMALAYPLALYHMAMQDGATQNNARTIKKSSLTVFRNTWLTAIVAVSICLYWVAIPVHNVGGLPWFLAVPCALVISAYIALYGAIFAVITHATKDSLPPLTRGLFAGLIWCLLEYARNVVLTGFPWLSLSAAFVPWPMVTQSAALVGTYALSGLLVMSATLYYEAYQAHFNHKDKVTRIKTGTWAANIVTVILAFGIYQLYFTDDNVNDNMAQALHGAFIQGNIDQNAKWSKSYENATVQQYLNLSREAISPLPNDKAFIKPSLLIWPETSLPFFFQDEKIHGAAIMDFSQKHDVAILLGAPAYSYPPRTADTEQNNQEYDLYNRAYLVKPDSDSTAAQRAHNMAAGISFYDKEHLVPFGEYVPSWLKISFLEGLMQGVGTFTAGGQGSAYINANTNGKASNQNNAYEQKPLLWQDLALGMLICYESIFPELAQERVEQGATLLINISNDAWFGDSSAPAQHLQLSAMRAVEQGRYLARGTNTGISALVDDKGRIIEQGPLFRATSIAFTAYARHDFTLFHRLEPYLPYIVLVLTIFLFAFYAPRKKKRT